MERPDTKALIADLLGNLSEAKLEQARAYLEQLKTTHEWADSLEAQEFLASIDPVALCSVPDFLCKRYQVVGLALREEEQQLELAIADTCDVVAIDAIKLITGLTILPRKVAPELIRVALDRFFSSSTVFSLLGGKGASR